MICNCNGACRGGDGCGGKGDNGFYDVFEGIPALPTLAEIEAKLLNYPKPFDLEAFKTDLAVYKALLLRQFPPMVLPSIVFGFGSLPDGSNN